MKYFVALALLVLLSTVAPSLRAQDHPSAQISNGLITSKIYLPDPENGYYRGTRFDWSGAISSLTYKGHEYFGEWQKSSDPYLHDRITGPVNEYRSNGKGVGYDEAPVGGRFIRIGVGVCEKPDETDYRWTHSYKVVDPGKWTTQRGENWIEFVHDVTEPVSGYAYLYTKRLKVGDRKSGTGYDFRRTKTLAINANSPGAELWGQKVSAVEFPL